MKSELSRKACPEEVKWTQTARSSRFLEFALTGAASQPRLGESQEPDQPHGPPRTTALLHSLPQIIAPFCCWFSSPAHLIGQVPNGDPTATGATGAVIACESQAVTKLKKIFVVVGNSGCHDPAPTLACCPVRAEARVEPFSRNKDKPSPTRVRSCRCDALARRNCGGIPGDGGHRLWGRFERSDFSDPNCDF